MIFFNFDLGDMGGQTGSEARETSLRSSTCLLMKEVGIDSGTGIPSCPMLYPPGNIASELLPSFWAARPLFISK